MSTATSPVTGLSHIQLTVSDVGSSERWYSLVLGLDRLTAAEDGTYVALLHRPSKIVVVLSLAPGSDSPEAPYTPLDHIAFAVPDARALAVWADQLGTLGVDHNGVVDEDGRPSLMLIDPDGINVELVAPATR
jgi:glyoxylase I family protein